MGCVKNLEPNGDCDGQELEDAVHCGVPVRDLLRKKRSCLFRWPDNDVVFCGAFGGVV
jgi:hypothetical protein